ncbi:MAG: UDP-3-O-acyl-N-acetylglucosamine deacetylase [Alphaproteobacteria bacterium]|nr:UDP-3-O-acyl-N-acetylglucosamine deacetylase [Alphaproteobacteria bacterium]
MASRSPTRRAGPIVRQKTLKSAIGCTGIGLHSGAKVRMTLHPAASDTGIVFRRRDLDRDNEIAALWTNVSDTRLCSRLSNASGASVMTVEHVMAALAGAEIDNCIVEVNGPEIPAMDGSAAPFLFLIECAGVTEQPLPRRAIQVLRPVSLADGDKRMTIAPGGTLTIDCTIDFDSTAISRQSITTTLETATFREDIARARTFGFAHEVAQLRAAGLARGGSLENAVVIDGDRVLNADGVRFPDEFVRHKVLDCVGDLYLAGGPLLARVRSERAGHELNNLILRELFSRDATWRRVDLTEDLLAATSGPIRGQPQLVAG